MSSSSVFLKSIQKLGRIAYLPFILKALESQERDSVSWFWRFVGNRRNAWFGLYSRPIYGVDSLKLSSKETIKSTR